MISYIHKVQYYETDRMGVTHHSNYIRWMEEARVYFLDSIGWNYARMEQNGISSPVVSVQCDYKNSTTFDDVVSIQVGVVSCKGARLVVQYTMRCNDKIVCIGQSSHCFLDENGKILRLQTGLPELYNAFLGHLIEK